MNDVRTSVEIMESIVLSGDEQARDRMRIDIAGAEMRRTVAELELYRCLAEEKAKKERYARIYPNDPSPFDDYPEYYDFTQLPLPTGY
jgi:hypothetical protein